MNVSIVGSGYVGLVTGLCLSDCGHRVTCVDIDADKIARLAAGTLPIHEAGLDDLLDRHLGVRFFPSTDLDTAVRDSDLTMITVGTPFEDGAISLRFVAAAAAGIGRALAAKPGYHVVVVKSTVVPGTTDGLVRRTLEETSGKKSGTDFGVGMNPEFLREGEAVEDFQKPDRIVLGGNDARCLARMAELYAAFPETQQIHTNTHTAEMIKYASNGLLATLISFSNEIGNLCSAVPGVDAVDVLNAVHLDKRISPIAPDGSRVTPGITSYLKAGCGFGGSCFPKDVRALIRWSEEHNRPPRILSAVLETNQKQPAELLSLLRKHRPVLEGAKIAVLGLAFKPGTDDIRESPALRLIPVLTREGAQVTAYDPIATAPMQAVLGHDRLRYAMTLAEAIEGADAIVVLTAWPEFQALPDLLDRLPSPPVVVDGRRVLDPRRVRRYEGIGLGQATPTSDDDNRSPVGAAHAERASSRGDRR